MTSATQIPHFEKDFWIKKLEDLIEELDQKKDIRICEVAETTAVHQKSVRVKNGDAGNQVKFYD